MSKLDTKQMKKYNHFGKQEQRYKTTFQVFLIYAIIAALIAFIVNFNEVVIYLKTLL
jgi:hypothetical protein